MVPHLLNQRNGKGAIVISLGRFDNLISFIFLFINVIFLLFLYFLIFLKSNYQLQSSKFFSISNQLNDSQ